MELTEIYSPLWAPHVKGRYSKLEVDPETHEREPQRVEAVCEICEARYRNDCRQGMPRRHVLEFSKHHLHRNVIAKPKP